MVDASSKDGVESAPNGPQSTFPPTALVDFVIIIRVYASAQRPRGGKARRGGEQAIMTPGVGKHASLRTDGRCRLNCSPEHLRMGLARRYAAQRAARRLAVDLEAEFWAA